MIGQSVEMLIPSRYRAEHPQRRQEFMACPEVHEMGSGRELYARTQGRKRISCRDRLKSHPHRR